MRHLVKYVNLSGALLASLLAIGCHREPGPAEKVDEYAFNYVIDIEHGVRNDAKVIRLPKVSVTVTEGDDAADYTVYYTVDGKDAKTVKNVWLNTAKDISSSFASCTDYGTYVLKGEIYRSDGRGEVKSFESPVYMSGEEIESMEAIFVVGREERVFGSDPVGFYVTESGYLEGRFSPKTAHITVELNMDGDEVFSFFKTDESSTNDGIVKIPFEVTKAGSGKLMFTLRTGEKAETLVQEYTAVRDPEHDYSLAISVQVPSYVYSGEKVPVTLSLESGKNDVQYDATFYLDDKAVASNKGISLASPLTKKLDPGKELKKHTVRVVVTRSDGSATAEASAEFTVEGVPVENVKLSCNGSNADVSGKLSLASPSGEKLTVSFFPENATVSSYTVESLDQSVLTVDQDGTAWKVSAGSGLFGRTSIRVTVRGAGSKAFEIPVEVSCEIPVRITQETSLTNAPILRIRLDDPRFLSTGICLSCGVTALYHGTCSYYSACEPSYPAYDHRNEMETIETDQVAEPVSVNWRIRRDGGSAILFNFSSRKKMIEEMYEVSSWWDNANPADEWVIESQDEHYVFHYDGARVSIGISEPKDLKDLITVKLTSKPSGVTVKL